MSGASLSVRAGGSRLSLSDEEGTPRAWLSVDKNGGGLSLSENGVVSRASLFVDKDGGRLSLYDDQTQTRAVLGATATKTPDGKKVTYPESSILLFGADGKVIWQAQR